MVSTAKRGDFRHSLALALQANPAVGRFAAIRVGQATIDSVTHCDREVSSQ